MGSHLIFQLILSVHFMLSDIEVVSGVVVDRLYKAEDENIQNKVFQKLEQLKNFKYVNRMAWTRTKNSS